METTLLSDLTKCVCGFEHGRPVSDEEIVNTLDESWAAGEIEVYSSLADVQQVSDFHLFHVTPWVHSKWRKGIEQDTCLYGHRHRRPVCTGDCSTDF